MRRSEGIQRRKPRQARAQFTYDSIVAAAVQVLARCGPEAFSANLVAERAGVSIGTLYQYFSDKETILLAAARRELAQDTPLHEALLEALLRTLESLLGAKASRTPPTVGTRRNAGPKGIASQIETVLNWILPLLVIARPLRAVTKRRQLPRP